MLVRGESKVYTPAAFAPENEPRQSPHGGNDPSPYGSFDLKGRAHIEGGSDRVSTGKVEFRILLWAYCSAL
jgi:hypothetical protein